MPSSKPHIAGFAHDVPVERTVRTHSLFQRHFSFTNDLGGFVFERQSVGDRSHWKDAISWDRSAQRVKLRVDRADPTNQLLSWSVPAATSQTGLVKVSSTFAITQQGNQTIFWPLLVTRAHNTALDGAHAGVAVRAEDGDSGQLPLAVLEIVDSRGAIRARDALRIGVGVTYGVSLSYDLGSGAVEVRLNAPDGEPLNRVRAHVDDPTSIASRTIAIAIQSDGTADDTVTFAWVDDVDVTIEDAS